VTFAGFLTPLKNPLALIEAFSRVLERHPDATLVLAGGPVDGPYAASCRAMAEASGISEAITFLGRIDRAALAEVLGESRVLALPSLAENAPMVISEAFWMGVPVVASDVGGVRHMVRNGVDGVLVPAGDVQRLGDALVEVLSDEEGRQWTEHATEAGAVYAPERVAAQTLSMYQEVVHRVDSRPSA
jgi:glycosyltransferase involved in cell wall biosynthesis